MFFFADKMRSFSAKNIVCVARLQKLAVDYMFKNVVDINSDLKCDTFVCLIAFFCNLHLSYIHMRYFYVCVSIDLTFRRQLFDISYEVYYNNKKRQQNKKYIY